MQQPTENTDCCSNSKRTTDTGPKIIRKRPAGEDNNAAKDCAAVQQIPEPQVQPQLLCQACRLHRPLGRRQPRASPPLSCDLPAGPPRAPPPLPSGPPTNPEPYWAPHVPHPTKGRQKMEQAGQYPCQQKVAHQQPKEGCQRPAAERSVQDSAPVLL
jgi:hypothetical protein